MTEYLSSSDAFMWSLGNDPVLRSTIVTLILLDSPPDWDLVVERFDRISRVVPRFRQRVTTSVPPVPPCWEVDPAFDLSFHLRRTRAPEPATLSGLLRLAEHAEMGDFDRAHPLWEVTLVDGLADGGAALLCKLDHALTDGVGAVEVAEILYDRTPAPPRVPLPTAPESTTRRAAAIRNVLSYEAKLATEVATRAIHIAPAALGMVRHPVDTAAATWSTAASVYRTARPISGPRSPIMRARTPIRRIVTHEVPKTALLQAGHAAGGSLNDTFVAAVLGGLHRYHARHNTAAKSLVVSMPISIRTSADPVGGNRATLIRFDVPADVTDPAQRIRHVRERTGAARNERSLAHTESIAAALNVLPRSYVSSALRHVDFIASDVPGFPVPMFLAGAPIRMQYAFSPTLGAAVNVTLLSYRDTCAIGANLDTGAIPDVDIFRECLIEGFDEMLTLGQPA